MGLTVLLAAGAVAATYAALSSSSRRAVSQPPRVAQVQPAPPLAPAVPSVAPTLPRHHRRHKLISRAPTIRVPKPGQRLKRFKPVATPKAAPKVTVPSAPNPAQTGPAVGTGPRQITLDTDAASTYNPYAFPVTRFGAPATAIDSDPTTAWTAQADPNGRIDAGLAIDLKSPHKVRALRIQGTRGLTVEIYGTQGPPPASITDPAWAHVGSANLTRRPLRVALKGAGKLQALVLWIATAKPGSEVKIAEVSVFR